MLLKKLLRKKQRLIAIHLTHAFMLVYNLFVDERYLVGRHRLPERSAMTASLKLARFFRFGVCVRGGSWEK